MQQVVLAGLIAGALAVGQSPAASAQATSGQATTGQTSTGQGTTGGGSGAQGTTTQAPKTTAGRAQAAAGATSLGSVRLTRAVKANGQPLAPGSYTVRLTEEQARAAHGDDITVLRWPYHENDRAQAERTTEGFVKVVTDAGGRVRGAGIVGQNAGELIQMWSLAVSEGLSIKAMTQWISPYPTLSEINKRAAFGYYAAAAAKPLVRRVIGWLTRFG